MLLVSQHLRLAWFAYHEGVRYPSLACLLNIVLLGTSALADDPIRFLAGEAAVARRVDQIDVIGMPLAHFG